MTPAAASTGDEHDDVVTPTSIVHQFKRNGSFDKIRKQLIANYLLRVDDAASSGQPTTITKKIDEVVLSVYEQQRQQANGVHVYNSNSRKQQLYSAILPQLYSSHPLLLQPIINHHIDAIAGVGVDLTAAKAQQGMREVEEETAALAGIGKRIRAGLEDILRPPYSKRCRDTHDAAENSINLLVETIQRPSPAAVDVSPASVITVQGSVASAVTALTPAIVTPVESIVPEMPGFPQLQSADANGHSASEG